MDITGRDLAVGNESLTVSMTPSADSILVHSDHREVITTFEGSSVEEAKETLLSLLSTTEPAMHLSSNDDNKDIELPLRENTFLAEDRGLTMFESSTSLETEKFELILQNYAMMKDSYASLQKEHEILLLREKDLCNTLHSNNVIGDEAVVSLTEVNCELRSHLVLLVAESTKSRETTKRFQDEIGKLKAENGCLSDQLSVVSHNCDCGKEMEKLCHINAKLKESELDAREKLRSHDTAAKHAISALQKEMAMRIDQVTCNLDEAICEKQDLVATIDKLENLLSKNKQDHSADAKKVVAQVKEMEHLQFLMREKDTQLAQCTVIMEMKDNDNGKLTEEIQAKKEEIESLSMKTKWAQNKLRQELESHKETKKQLTVMTTKWNEIKEEADQIRTDCQEMIEKYQDSEEMKSVQLDQQLKEQDIFIKMKECEISVQDELQHKQKKELEALKGEHRKVLDAMTHMKEELSKTSAKLAENEQGASNSSEKIAVYSSQLEVLESRLADYHLLKSQLHRHEDNLQEYKERESSLRGLIQEHENTIQLSRQKEAELLSFSEKLAKTNAASQAQTSYLQTKLNQITEERLQFAKDLSDLTSTSIEEVTRLKGSVAEKDSTLESLKSQLEQETNSVVQLTSVVNDYKEEAKLLKKKHAATTKDFQRQLQQSKKKIDQIETGSLNASQENLSLKSRTSSNSSLEKIQNHSPEYSSSPMLNQIDTMAMEYSIVQPALQAKKNSSGDGIDIDKSVLVDRICRLQKAHAKKNEKLDFLEEHINTLVEELQNKTRILQYYFLREDSGSLVSDQYDKNKVDVSKRGGIMASVYSSRPHDKDMTLNLSLQINTKLQTVLEDLILKNMTLKENIDTLSMEIERLQKGGG